MRNTFFASIKRALFTSTAEVSSVGSEKNLGTNVMAGIQHLLIEDLSAVAGGPQVQNVPED
ncbi:hypothetical protein Jab_2c01400 [Janthinobacterium sp. HH01]|uniref:hypothetical protein n=1 Tax=Janthinobacterium sp. HH01 TaxID=1198452 RepID=UPI0002AEC8D3|nr:hypothetical protein [Janthinobacterium sp. HH01]ELX08095.1 hypothetical protein Jab_2c01400 [Janthinobacterium sp. HH01]